jgi:hypothetical protein
MFLVFIKSSLRTKLKFWVNILPEADQGLKFIHFNVVEIFTFIIDYDSFFTVLEFLNDLNKIIKAVCFLKKSLIVAGIFIEYIMR